MAHWLNADRVHLVLHCKNEKRLYAPFEVDILWRKFRRLVEKVSSLRSLQNGAHKLLQKL